MAARADVIGSVA